MFDLRKIPLLRVLLPFFGGVLAGLQISFKIRAGLPVAISLFIWVLVVLIFFWQRGRPGWGSWLLSSIMYLIFIITGAVTGLLSRPSDPDLPVGEWVIVRGEIKETPHPGKYTHSFEMESCLLFAGDTIVRQCTLLKGYIRLQGGPEAPVAGEKWQFSGKLLPIENSGNPGETDFKSIMNRKDCWYRFYVYSGPNAVEFNRKLDEGGRKKAPALVRSLFSGYWHGPEEDVALLKAVCLGDRSSLTDDLLQVYTIAGGMHLLAVSGLHVGLIWWVLQTLTRWLNRFFNSEKPRIVFLLGFLWFYAFVTGFSSSVCRSVTMFSFFSVSRVSGQRTHAVNGILVSAFFLVLADPVRLMDVGFQLSYTAILGIVVFHPLCRSLFSHKRRVLRWFWNAISLSLAAQLSTAPLVIYYFHQLPLYSILSSLVAIPMLSALIALFVCSVPFISAGILHGFFNFILIRLAHLMNCSMEFFSSLPGALKDGLKIDPFTLYIWLLLILMLMIAVHSRSRIPRYLLLLLSAVFILWASFTDLRRTRSAELLIGHFNGASQIIIREGRTLDEYCWYRDTTSREYVNTSSGFSWSKSLYDKRLYESEGEAASMGRISSCIRLKEGVWAFYSEQYRGLVISASVDEQFWMQADQCILQDQAKRPDFILLSGEPEVGGLNKTDWLREVEIVIDGSNRSWYRERMEGQSEKIYLTDRSGAWVKRW